MANQVNRFLWRSTTSDPFKVVEDLREGLVGATRIVTDRTLARRAVDKADHRRHQKDPEHDNSPLVEAAQYLLDETNDPAYRRKFLNLFMVTCEFYPREVGGLFVKAGYTSDEVHEVFNNCEEVAFIGLCDEEIVDFEAEGWKLAQLVPDGLVSWEFSYEEAVRERVAQILEQPEEIRGLVEELGTPQSFSEQYNITLPLLQAIFEDETFERRGPESFEPLLWEDVVGYGAV